MPMFDATAPASAHLPPCLARGRSLVIIIFQPKCDPGPCANDGFQLSGPFPRPCPCPLPPAYNVAYIYIYTDIYTEERPCLIAFSQPTSSAGWKLNSHLRVSQPFQKCLLIVGIYREREKWGRGIQESIADILLSLAMRDICH